MIPVVQHQNMALALNARGEDGMEGGTICKECSVLFEEGNSGGTLQRVQLWPAFICTKLNCLSYVSVENGCFYLPLDPYLHLGVRLDPSGCILSVLFTFPPK